MSLYYDLNNDVDLMNFLMEKHGYSLAMIKFNKIKTDSGYHQKTSYEGAAQITRWVKTKKNAKPDASKPDAPKPDASKLDSIPDTGRLQDEFEAMIAADEAHHILANTPPPSPNDGFNWASEDDDDDDDDDDEVDGTVASAWPPQTFPFYDKNGNHAGSADTVEGANAACAAWGRTRCCAGFDGHASLSWACSHIPQRPLRVQKTCEPAWNAAVALSLPPPPKVPLRKLKCGVISPIEGVYYQAYAGYMCSEHGSTNIVVDSSEDKHAEAQCSVCGVWERFRVRRYDRDGDEL